MYLQIKQVKWIKQIQQIKFRNRIEKNVITTVNTDERQF